MATKMETFKASLTKNIKKGGAWLLHYQIVLDGVVRLDVTQAWSNPSAAKRSVKEAVLANTPRKSIKWEPTRMSEANKPITFSGVLEYKVKA
jgi:hypothetical protein